MSVTESRIDPERLALVMTAEFDAPPERVWQVWADPRQLERWWGPPGFPATVVDHDFRPGGRANYFMTEPDGTRHHGWWVFEAVAPPDRLEFTDGFADAEGAPDTGMPVMRGIVTLTARPGGGTVMVIDTRFASEADMGTVLEMGMEQGMTMALGQIPGILAGEGR
jgi:uncharacterized protein YndB with AHSA1/START domain